MVNWTDPSVISKDSLALIRLNHIVAGIYFWETVVTAGFELDVLRGKRPYRWTIWLYLGTRYFALLTITLFLVGADGNKVSCQPYTTTMALLEYLSWEFASFVIVLRVIAIWNRNRLVSTLAVGLWLAALGVNIYCLSQVKAFNSPSQQGCIVLGLDKSVVSATGILVVDTTLIMGMLIGLLRNVHGGITGICRILYQQCFIWIALAAIAEVPLVVFLNLNLNPVWNEMFGQASIAILAIGATRMYRSLCQRGSFTEYVSTERTKAPSGVPFPDPGYKLTNLYGRMKFAPASQSDGAVTAFSAPVVHVQSECAISASSAMTVHENTEDKVGYDMA